MKKATISSSYNKWRIFTTEGSVSRIRIGLEKNHGSGSGFSWDVRSGSGQYQTGSETLHKYVKTESKIWNSIRLGSKKAIRRMAKR